MEIEKQIENGQGVIYHELGHLFAYLLANKNIRTNLGKVKRFETGFIYNRVTPMEKYYHSDNISKDKNEIAEATLKTERTLAWFVEVIAGCTFQCSFEQIEFNHCFGPQKEKIGSLDFGNLNVIRNLSSFEWKFCHINLIQKDFEDIIEKYQIINKLEPIVSQIKKCLLHSSENQIYYENEELNNLTQKLDELITTEIINDYLKLIEKYYTVFQN